MRHCVKARWLLFLFLFLGPISPCFGASPEMDGDYIYFNAQGSRIYLNIMNDVYRLVRGNQAHAGKVESGKLSRGNSIVTLSCNGENLTLHYEKGERIDRLVPERPVVACPPFFVKVRRESKTVATLSRITLSQCRVCGVALGENASDVIESFGGAEPVKVPQGAKYKQFSVLCGIGELYEQQVLYVGVAPRTELVEWLFGSVLERGGETIVNSKSSLEEIRRSFPRSGFQVEEVKGGFLASQSGTSVMAFWEGPRCRVGLAKSDSFVVNLFRKRR